MYKLVENKINVLLLTPWYLKHVCDLIIGKSSTSCSWRERLHQDGLCLPHPPKPHTLCFRHQGSCRLCTVSTPGLCPLNTHTHTHTMQAQVFDFVHASSHSQYPGPVYQAIIIPVILWASVWEPLLQAGLLTAWSPPHHPCRPLPAYSTLVCSHLFTLLSPCFFLLFYFLNYESMITHLHKTGKIQNKVTYSSTI